MISKFRILLATALLFVSTHAFSADPDVSGLWKTESTDKGYLQVSVENCGDAVCGTILQALDLEGNPIPDYEHIGKQMIWDMASKTATSWAGGKIWDPSKDKTYKSKMTLAGDVLKVSGCIAFICRSQSWTRLPS